MINNNLPVLVVIIPLLLSLITAIAGWTNKKISFPIAVIALIINCFLTIQLFIQVIVSGLPIEYKLAGWKAPIGIVYIIDYLNAIVLVVISAVALINLISYKKSIETEYKNKETAFYTLYLLFVTGLLGMTATGDAFNLYVLLEIAALSGYGLIGLGTKRAPLASLNYLFIGTIGASFYLLGIGYIYIATGSLNMSDIASIIPNMLESKIILFAFIICITGILIKMAVFPFHAWLPQAYSESSSVASGVIAPLTTKVMIYVLIRLCLYVFTPEYVFQYLNISDFMVWLAIATILFGAFSALAQKDYKKMLTYIIIAEVGYMLGGFFLGNNEGMSGAILHIINDAVMTLALFLAAGIFLWKTGSTKRKNFQGLFSKMPFTMAGFTLAALSVIGVPPTCGFFSKWYLVLGGIQAGQYAFVVTLIISSLINAILFFRIFEIAYFEPFLESKKVNHKKQIITEAPLTMLIPFLFVAISLVILGIYAEDIVINIIQYAI